MADFYIRSALSLDRVLRNECSVKAAASPHPDAGRVLAILINSLAYRSALLHALEEAKVLKLEERVFTLAPPSSASKSSLGSSKSSKEPLKKKQKPHPKSDAARKEYPSKEAFLLVLTHDLIFQSRGIQASKTWPPKTTLERYRPSLHSALVKLQIKQGKSRIADLRTGALYAELTARIPRWIRINTLRSTKEEVFSWLEENNYFKVDGDELNGVKEFSESKYVPGLLAFHPKATSALLQSELYGGNKIIMQDLASCFPAYILDPLAEAQVVDATSAPGNKTSHLSAIMHSKPGPHGKVHAFERDAARYKVLHKRLGAVGALSSPKIPNGNVVPERKDFLTISPSDFSLVTHMLVDPSCSGSGIVNRLDFLKEDDEAQLPEDVSADGQTKLERRLHQLSEFQLLMLKHAFLFPSLMKLVYSTCSVHKEENEHVVIKALDTEEAQEGGWRLAGREEVIPTWPVRGDVEACGGRKDVAESVIRCVPGGKGEGEKPNVESCNGFFVACFVRSGKRGEKDKEGPKRVLEEEEEEEEEEEKEEEDGVKEEGEKGSKSNAAANRKKKLQKRRKKMRLLEEQKLTP